MRGGFGDHAILTGNGIIPGAAIKPQCHARCAPGAFRPVSAKHRFDGYIIMPRQRADHLRQLIFRVEVEPVERANRV